MIFIFFLTLLYSVFSNKYVIELDNNVSDISIWINTMDIEDDMVLDSIINIGKFKGLIIIGKDEYIPIIRKLENVKSVYNINDDNFSIDTNNGIIDIQNSDSNHNFSNNIDNGWIYGGISLIGFFISIGIIGITYYKCKVINNQTEEIDNGEDFSV